MAFPKGLGGRTSPKAIKKAKKQLQKIKKATKAQQKKLKELKSAQKSFRMAEMAAQDEARFEQNRYERENQSVPSLNRGYNSSAASNPAGGSSQQPASGVPTLRRF